MEALQFSGGKDSLACLYILEDRWEDLRVVWLNTGLADAKTEKYMAHWAAKLPHFVEVRTDAARQIEKMGYPVDVLPTWNTSFGQACSHKRNVKLQSWIECCNENIWAPLHEATRRLEVETVYRGQRNEETMKSFRRSGFVEDGVKYVFPIEGWSKDMVLTYLENKGAYMPDYYREELTSRDCWSCTAYLTERKEQIANLPPFQKDVVHRRLEMIQMAIQEENVIPQILGV